MEYKFIKVHTGKDLAISTMVLFAGIGLFFVNKGLGFCVGMCGLFMYFFYKGGYKKDGRGIVLIKKSEDICKGCRSSIIDFLNGKNNYPEIKKGSEGGCIRLEVYYNKTENVAYVQLFDFCTYDYESATGIIQLDSARAEILLSLL